MLFTVESHRCLLPDAYIGHGLKPTPLPKGAILSVEYQWSTVLDVHASSKSFCATIDDNLMVIDWTENVINSLCVFAVPANLPAGTWLGQIQYFHWELPFVFLVISAVDVNLIHKCDRTMILPSIIQILHRLSSHTLQVQLQNIVELLTHMSTAAWNYDRWVVVKCLGWGRAQDETLLVGEDCLIDIISVEIYFKQAYLEMEMIFILLSQPQHLISDLDPLCAWWREKDPFVIASPIPLNISVDA